MVLVAEYPEERRDDVNRILFPNVYYELSKITDKIWVPFVGPSDVEVDSLFTQIEDVRIKRRKSSEIIS